MKTKRSPLLCDMLLAKRPRSNLMSPKVEDQVLDLLVEAKRFVLTPESASYFGQLIHDYPELIAQEMEFAIPPFPLCYFEIPFEPFWRAVTHREPDATADVNVAYLISGPRVYVMASGRGFVQLCPYGYRLNQPLSQEESLAIAKAIAEPRLAIDSIFWGESYPKLDVDMRRALRASHGVEFYCPEVYKTEVIQFWTHGAGDVRNIIGLMLLMNRASQLTILSDIPSDRGVIGNKSATFLRHSVVTFKVNPLPRIVKLAPRRSPRGAVREHDVRGHFCHNRKGKSSCTHQWIEYKPNKWRCDVCGGIRWFREAFRRGKRDKGVVKTSYQVTCN